MDTYNTIVTPPRVAAAELQAMASVPKDITGAVQKMEQAIDFAQECLANDPALSSQDDIMSRLCPTIWLDPGSESTARRLANYYGGAGWHSDVITEPMDARVKVTLYPEASRS